MAVFLEGVRGGLERFVGPQLGQHVGEGFAPGCAQVKAVEEVTGRARQRGRRARLRGDALRIRASLLRPPTRRRCWSKCRCSRWRLRPAGRIAGSKAGCTNVGKRKKSSGGQLRGVPPQDGRILTLPGFEPARSSCRGVASRPAPGCGGGVSEGDGYLSGDRTGRPVGRRAAKSHDCGEQGGNKAGQPGWHRTLDPISIPARLVLPTWRHR